MYEYISGRIDSIYEDYVVVDVTGIGYKVFSSTNSLSEIKVGEVARIFTHLAVKEDDLILFGFSNREELRMFKLLITVSGVGPKAALSLLSRFKPNDIAAAIISKETNKLIAAQGIGKKIAERIVLELKDKIDTQDAIKMSASVDSSDDVITQVIEALTSLGYNYGVAVTAVTRLQDKNKPIDGLIKDALRQLSML